MKMKFTNMKDSRFTLWVLLLCGFVSQSLSAQPVAADSMRLSPKARWHTVSAEEMIQGYRQWCDTPYWYRRPLVYEGTSAELFIDKLLERNESFRNRNLLATWYLGVDANGIPGLYIESLRDSATGRPDTLLLQQARTRYGQLPPIENVEEPGGQVPAPWLSGQLRTITRPLRYFAFTVSNGYSVYSLKQGKRRRIWRESIFPVYRRTVMKCLSAGGIVADGHWADNLDMEMLLLSHDASRYCRPDTTLKRVRTYDLLVLTDRQGCISDVRVLKPDNLTAQDQGYVDELRRFFRQLSPWSLHLLYSSDGRVFPGHYLKAVRAADYWSLRDYLQDAYRFREKDAASGQK